MNPVPAPGRLIRCDDYHAPPFRLLRGRALRIKTDDHFVSAVAQVLCLRMSLAAVAENCDALALQGIGVGVLLVENSSHKSSSFIRQGMRVSPSSRCSVRVTEGERASTKPTDRSAISML